MGTTVSEACCAEESSAQGRGRPRSLSSERRGYSIKETVADKGKNTPVERISASPVSFGKCLTPGFATTRPRNDSVEEQKLPSSQKSLSSIGIDDFDRLKVLGVGTNSKTYLARHKMFSDILVLKKVKKKNLVGTSPEMFLGEKLPLLDTKSPFIAHLHYAFETPKAVFVGQEYVPGGQLIEFARKRHRFNEVTAQFYAAEVILALEHLHDHLGYALGDLKESNILLDDEGHVKITCLGTAGSGFVPPTEYSAPEALAAHGGQAADWWSLGCLIFELIDGRPPFGDARSSSHCLRVTSGRLTFSQGMSLYARDLVSRLLNVDVTERLTTARRVKGHPFFSRIDWSALAARKVAPPLGPPQRDSVNEEGSDMPHDHSNIV
eukprot:TRINITY_DN5480_c0_g1_i2.p1 TRINITY_DN5480_c0_g1~~TRINITY_DN5480_c0_g1_i2.p1  ORF type:complete len:379 (-),score=57.02 TRINITY_DN5480_c0_g1_i2:93-1229(-)